MFRSLIVACVLCVVAAFAPKAAIKTRSAMKLNAEPMVGGSVEVKYLFPNSLGDSDKVYDPIGFLELHALNPDVFPHPKWLREAELKHCRGAMLASIGAFSAQWGLVIPGYEDTLNADPTGNLHDFFVGHPAGFAQIILAIGIVEGSSNPSAFWTGKGDREAGNFHFDPTNFWGKQTQASKNSLQLKELKNGRLAMMGFAGYMAEHWIPGSVPFLPGKF